MLESVRYFLSGKRVIVIAVILAIPLYSLDPHPLGLLLVVMELLMESQSHKLILT